MGSGDPLPPVNFDYGQANAVITQLNTLVTRVDTQRRDRMTNGHQMRENWKGRYAVEFDGELTRMWNEGGTNIDAMNALKRKISNAIDATHAEQRRRDRYNQQLQQQQQQNQPDVPLGPGGLDSGLGNDARSLNQAIEALDQSHSWGLSIGYGDASAGYASTLQHIATETVSSGSDDPTVSQFVNYLNDASLPFTQTYATPTQH